MVGRPIDHRRRRELLDAAVDHAARCSFADLSWRSVAAALGVSTTTLVHHFGTREDMHAAILERLRQRIVTATAELAGEHPDLPTAARAVWAWSSDPEQASTFRLFFAVYGHAMQAPEASGGFLGRVGEDWLDALCAAQGPDTDPVLARDRATLVIATIRGLLLDLLAGGDRSRVTRAAEQYLAGLRA